MELAEATQRPGRAPRYLASSALASLLAAIIVVVATSPGSSRPHSSPGRLPYRSVRRLPPYWTVRPGETYTQIAKKTGLTIDQLQAFNPRTDPRGLLPGQRVKLWLHPPPPRPKPLPRFWIVRRGQSFGLIAAKTGINLVRLQRLNPGLKPTTLQPGDRVRLRR